MSDESTEVRHVNVDFLGEVMIAYVPFYGEIFGYFEVIYSTE